MSKSPANPDDGSPDNAASATSDAWQRWLHFADAGGHDKDRMITMSTSLLSLAAAVGAIAISDGLPSDPEYLAPALGGLGVVLSALSFYLVLLYGGYSNRNWARAEKIAKANGWKCLLHDSPDQPEPSEDSGWLVQSAWKRAAPCNPRDGLARVFNVYLMISVGVALAHIVIALAGLGAAS